MLGKKLPVRRSVLMKTERGIGNLGLKVAILPVRRSV
jgi:hypothetical protein